MGLKTKIFILLMLNIKLINIVNSHGVWSFPESTSPNGAAPLMRTKSECSNCGAPKLYSRLPLCVDQYPIKTSLPILEIICKVSQV